MMSDDAASGENTEPTLGYTPIFDPSTRGNTDPGMLAEVSPYGTRKPASPYVVS